MNTDVPSEEYEAAARVMSALHLAWRNVAMYPAGNEICRLSLADAMAELDRFVSAHGDLRVDVEENRLYYEGKVVHEGPPDTGNLPDLLFREGIVWLEFARDIETSELNALFAMLKALHSRDGEPVGDLAAMLLDHGLPHLRYQTADVSDENDVLVDLSQLSVQEPGAKSLGVASGSQTVQGISHISLPEASTYSLSTEERESLARMVIEAEDRDGTRETVDALLILLEQQIEESIFDTVLRSLQDEFVQTLREKQFDLTYRILTEILRLRRKAETGPPSRVALLDRFTQAIVQPAQLGVLSDVWPPSEDTDSSAAEELQRVITLLPPEAILTLGPMLKEASSPGVRLQILNAISSLAKRNLQPLETLLNRGDTDVINTVLHVLGELKGKRSAELLAQFVRHPAPSTKLSAVRALTVRSHHSMVEVFSLIEDPNEEVSLIALGLMGRRRDLKAEDAVLDYMTRTRFDRRDRDRLMACYKTLGQCGSSRSLAFLQERLTARGGLPGSVGSLHKQGAAAALQALGSHDALSILETHGSSGIRRHTGQESNAAEEEQAKHD